MTFLSSALTCLLWRQRRDEFWLDMRPGPPLSFGNDLRYLPQLEAPALVKPQPL